jgi:hypothetical protein
MNSSCITLFLDFGGVLHPRSPSVGSDMFRALPFLNEALEEFQNLRIVITSSWRHHPKDLAWALDMFPLELRQRVLGCTPLIGGKDMREKEILTWLRDNRRENEIVAVLDDEPELFSELRGDVFAVDGASGFGPLAIADFRPWLTQKLAQDDLPEAT